MKLREGKIMNKNKFVLTEVTRECSGIVLHQIKAIRSFGNIKKGELGGWVEKEENLNQSDNSWVYDNACVYGNARIYNDAHISDNAYVFGEARVFDNARVSGDAWVLNNAHVFGNAYIFNNSCIFGNAHISGDAKVFKYAHIFGDAHISGDAMVYFQEHIAWFSSVGSERGTLTVYMNKNGEIEVTRGCFQGTLDQFIESMEKTLEKKRKRYKRFAEEYLILIEYIKLRFREVTVETSEDLK